MSLSADGSRVAVGAPLNRGAGSAVGHVRVFDSGPVAPPPLDPCGAIDLVTCYAPELRFHGSESAFPSDPRVFVAGSKLRWSDGALCGGVADDDVVLDFADHEVDELTAAYVRSFADNAFCQPDVASAAFKGTDLTRPFTEIAANGVSRPSGFATNQGFYLDPDPSLLAGLPVGAGGVVNAPAFVETSSGFGVSETGTIRYWFFYADDPKSPFNPLDNAYEHHGDWESIEIGFNAGSPEMVRFYGHGCAHTELDASDGALSWNGTHPVVHVSIGSHANYLSANTEIGIGDYPTAGCDVSLLTGISDATGDGTAEVWRTWEYIEAASGGSPTGIGNVVDQCWFGFGGAWGRVELSDSTGPVGPPFNSDTLQLSDKNPSACPPLPPTAFCDGEMVTINLNTNGGNGSGTDNNDVILGTSGADVIDGLGGDDIICGGGGDDHLSGGVGDDTIFGGGGDDTINGGAGDFRDFIYGGDGDDTINGGLGIDYIYGEAGEDTLDGDGGSDRMWGGADDDLMLGDSGVDRMWGGPGDDEMRGMGGQDFMWGEAGNDLMQGNFQTDNMWGGSGNDEMFGAGGKDSLFGGGGNDSLSGGNNTDYLHGGQGVDTANGGRGRDKPVFAPQVRASNGQFFGGSGCIAETIVNCQPTP